MAGTLPSGIGNPQQAQQATAYMRQQPWYAQLVTSWGLNPTKTDANGNLVDPRTGQSVKLTDQQQQQLIATARDNGIGISDSYNIDENGQIAKPDSHMLRNIAIAAGIAGLAVTGLGAAGIGPLAGAFGTGTGAAGAAGAGLAADGTLASTTIGSGFIPAITGGVGTNLSGLAAGAGAAGAAGAGAAAGAGVGGGSSVLGPAVGAGAKIAGLLGAGASVNNAFGNADAQAAQALTNNRFLTAKTDQSGPAADKTAFQNAMRAALVAKMNPNAAPLSLNGHALPSLVTPDSVNYAGTLFSNLSTRQANGQTPTEFGVPPATPQETDATNAASTSAKIGGALNAGSQLANLWKLFGSNSASTEGTDSPGGIPIPGNEFDPSVIYG